MADLTPNQVAAVQWAHAEITRRYQGEKAPPTAYLEAVANESIQTFTARMRARGEVVEDIRVRVVHVGGGNYDMTPIVPTPILSITIVGTIGT